MANSSPARLTITSTTGPGVAAVATVFTDVTDIQVNFQENTIRVTHGITITYYDYSAMATVTWTISSGATTIVISS